MLIEGWALYGEEMLMRIGLYAERSAAHAQLLRLSRYRAARIGVDVNLYTGRFSYEQAVHWARSTISSCRTAAYLCPRSHGSCSTTTARCSAR